MAFFHERPNLSECAQQLPLSSYVPSLALEGLLTGIDNIRQDVCLSPKFTQIARSEITSLVTTFGDVKDLLAKTPGWQAPPMGMGTKPSAAPVAEPGFKDALTTLLTSSLHHAKAEGNLSVDTLCRLAVIRLLRQEMVAQFAGVLERCRARLRSIDTPRQPFAQKALELGERTARFQQEKKTILRKVGQQLFTTLREIEKTTIARLRRSLFGDNAEVQYELFLNRLLFTEDGRDDLLNAEHYVMLGNFERDPDRLGPLRELLCSFLRTLGYGAVDGSELAGFLNEPTNAQILLPAGGQENDPYARLRQAVLQAWLECLQRDGVMDHIIAAYDVAPLLAEYVPPLNPQQLKIALISRAERKRVESLLEQHGRVSTTNINAAVRRIERYGSAEHARIATRFMADFLRYHRDLRRLETLNAALDGVNLITSEKLRELSAINHTLYEFLLPEEEKPVEQKVIHHIILKADVRESTLLTRTLYERGLNPASYFSLNFYGPINRLLPTYQAQKLFIEGDALILALFEREGEEGFGVGRACALAREILEIVRGYNELSQKSGLPALELGIGISYQDTAPLYLMDGNSPIMISPALNASDRLSSCSKGTRRFCAAGESIFNVFAFQMVDDADTAAGQLEEFLLRYNVGGIVLDEAAFQKLQQEIALEPHDVSLPTLWGEQTVRLYTGLVPVTQGIFHKVVVRESRIPHIDPREFQLKAWTDRRYYEVCTNQAVYERLGS
jgi:hypothetical protein